MDKDFSSYHSNLGFNSYEDGDHEASSPVRPRPVSNRNPSTLDHTVQNIRLPSPPFNSNNRGSSPSRSNGLSGQFPTSDNPNQATRNNLQGDLQPFGASGFNSHQDHSEHFFVNTADAAATTTQKQDWESTEYPVPITFIDRKTGTEYNPDGEPIIYPENNEWIKHSAEGYPQPAAHTFSGIDAIHALPDATTRYNDNHGSSPYTNYPIYPTDGTYTNPTHPAGYGNLTNYLQNNENPEYTPSGFPTGYSRSGVNSYGYNQGWASNQGSVVVQPSSYSNMAMTTPQQPISNYVPLSIFVTCMCCLPLGLWALSKAREAERLKELGHYEEARQKASEAGNLNCIGIVVGIILIGGLIGLTYWRFMG